MLLSFSQDITIDGGTVKCPAPLAIGYTKTIGSKTYHKQLRNYICVYFHNIFIYMYLHVKKLFDISPATHTQTPT